MNAKRVFISYSHDSDQHREKVLALSERLRSDGIETLLDQYVNGSPPQGWPRWMFDQLDAADVVLVVCTETYYRRFRGQEEPGKGKGVDWEGAFITQELYDSRSRTLKFVPVFLSEAAEDWIPEPLRSRTYYALTSQSAYDALYDFLLAQSGVEPGELGTPKLKQRRKGTPLTFNQTHPPPEAAVASRTLLIIGASPLGMPRLNIPEEIRQITAALDAAPLAGQVKLVAETDVRRKDFVSLLEKDQPDILHFTGYESDTGGIRLVDEAGQPSSIERDALVKFFKARTQRPSLFFLNTCRSWDLACSLASLIDYVIAYKGDTTDEIATRLAGVFYRGLATGLEVPAALDRAKSELGLEGVAESLLPDLADASDRDVPEAQPRTSDPTGPVPTPPALPDDARRQQTDVARSEPEAEPIGIPARDLVYISYSHMDRPWHQKLRKVLDADPAICDRVWDDTKIPASADFAREIDHHVARARVMIMLGSPHYFGPNSGAALCETQPALAAHRSGELQILWFPVSAYSYSSSPVGHIMAATGAGAQPLDQLSSSEQNKALRRVLQETRRCLGIAELPVTPKRRQPQPAGATRQGGEPLAQTPSTQKSHLRAASSSDEKTERTSIMQPPIDFVIITPLEEEREAMLIHLKRPKRLKPSNDDIRVYYPATFPVTFTDGTTGEYKLVVTDLLGMGRVEAANAVGDAIRRWRPKYIMVAGIAGGLAKAGVNVGDILISEQIADYELQKLTPKKTQIRWSVHKADPRLLGAAKQLRLEDWRPLIQAARPEVGESRRHVGPICTGDKVIANGLMDQYREVWTKLIGVEMEAGGAASGAFQAPDAPGFFMVRGVSDLADAKKDKVQTQSWRAYACDVAAAYVEAFLKSGPVVPVSDAAVATNPQ